MTADVQFAPFRVRVPVIPEAGRQPLSYLEKIVEKKVMGAALNCLEMIVDWLLTVFSCFYPAYDALYQKRVSQIKHLSDGTIVEDLTATNMVKIVSFPFDNLRRRIGRRGDQELMIGPTRRDCIYLNNHEVVFIPRPGELTLFGAPYNTDHMVIRDRANHPGHVVIREYETTGNIKETTVDTNREFSRAMPDGQRTQVYVIDQAIPLIQDRNYLREGHRLGGR